MALNKKLYAEKIKKAYDVKRDEIEKQLTSLGDKASVEQIEESLKRLQQIDGAEYRLLLQLNKVNGLGDNDPNKIRP